MRLVLPLLCGLLGFSLVPCAEVSPPVEKEVVQPEIQNGWLGIGVVRLDPLLAKGANLPKGVGLQVMEIAPDSPAQKAELKDGDILHKLDDQILINEDQFRQLIRMKPNAEVTMQIVRTGTVLILKIKLGQRAEMPRMKAPSTLLTPGLNDPMDDLLRKMQDPNGPFGRDHQEMLEEMLRRMQDHGGGLAPQIHRQQSVQSIQRTSDGTYTVEITEKNGAKTLKVTDDQDKVLYNGSIDDSKAIEALPEGARKLVESMTKPAPSPKAVPRAPKKDSVL